MATLKLLIIEDETLIALHLKIGLQKAGYAVVGPAVSGREAILLTQQENPDILVVDIRLMGDMDGIEAAQQIRDFSAARIIFTTGYQDADLKQRALVLNPLAYLIKPVNWRDIDSAIHAAHPSAA